MQILCFANGKIKARSGSSTRGCLRGFCIKMSQAECLMCSEDFSTLINNAGDVERQGLHIALHRSHADRKAQRVLRNQNTNCFMLNMWWLQQLPLHGNSGSYNLAQVKTMHLFVSPTTFEQVKVHRQSSSFHIGHWKRIQQDRWLNKAKFHLWPASKGKLEPGHEETNGDLGYQCSYPPFLEQSTVAINEGAA